MEYTTKAKGEEEEDACIEVTGVVLRFGSYLRSRWGRGHKRQMEQPPLNDGSLFLGP